MQERKADKKSLLRLTYIDLFSLTNKHPYKLWKKSADVLIRSPVYRILRKSLLSDLRHNHWFDSQHETCVSNIKDEASYLCPDSSQARLSPVTFPLCYLAPGGLHFWPVFWVTCQRKIRKWKHGLLREPLCFHLTFSGFKHQENLTFPAHFLPKDVRIDSTYLWCWGFYKGLDLCFVLRIVSLRTTTLFSFTPWMDKQ